MGTFNWTQCFMNRFYVSSVSTAAVPQTFFGSSEEEKFCHDVGNLVCCHIASDFHALRSLSETHFEELIAGEESKASRVRLMLRMGSLDFIGNQIGVMDRAPMGGGIDAFTGRVENGGQSYLR